MPDKDLREGLWGQVGSLSRVPCILPRLDLHARRFARPVAKSNGERNVSHEKVNLIAS